MGSVTDVSHCTICSMSSDHEDMDMDLDLDLRVGDLYLGLKANDLDLDSDLRSEGLTTTLAVSDTQCAGPCHFRRLKNAKELKDISSRE
jgi:hypothetical protein